MNNGDPADRIWVPGWSYIPPAVVPINPRVLALVAPPIDGVILYQVIDLNQVLALVAAYAALRIYVSFAAFFAVPRIGAFAFV